MRRLAVAAGATALALALSQLLVTAGRTAPAATFTVTAVADAPDATPGDGLCADAMGRCTLRAAVQEANAVAGLDEILLPAGTYVLDSPLAGAAGGDLDVTSDVSLQGAGPATTIVRAGPGERVLHVYLASDSAQPPEVILKGLRIEGGNAQVGGGVYAVAGHLSVQACEIVGNRAELGGGITVAESAILAVDKTTMSSNSAHEGGALFVGVPIQGAAPPTHTLTSSTLSGNEADVGGAVANSGLLEVAFATLANNSAPSGAGLFNGERTLLTSTIVADNTGGDCAGDNGSPVSGGHNLDGDGTCQWTGPGDVSGADPLLGALADNGGATRTRLPGAGSPALDAGGATCPATDQRGMPRPRGAACDIGAVEVDAPTTPGTPTGTPTAKATETRQPTVTATPTASPTREPTVAPSVTATATPGVGSPVCPYLMGRAPMAAINAALADPSKVSGYGMACNPNLPIGYGNQVRSRLSLRNIARPYHPVFNGLVFRCGCP